MGAAINVCTIARNAGQVEHGETKLKEVADF